MSEIIKRTNLLEKFAKWLSITICTINLVQLSIISFLLAKYITRINILKERKKRIEIKRSNFAEENKMFQIDKTTIFREHELWLVLKYSDKMITNALRNYLEGNDLMIRLLFSLHINDIDNDKNFAENIKKKKRIFQKGF